MTPERLRQIQELYHSAGEREQAQRTAFLAEACLDDEELRREVESLLAAYPSGACFLDEPVMREAAAILASPQNRSEYRFAPGLQLGPYIIEARLGAGGMGEVYRAKDKRLHRIVAIKVLPERLADTPGLRQRLEREAIAISSLNHPQICTLYDIGREGDVDYLVMEFLEGETLSHRLKRGAIHLSELLNLAIQIAGALAAAHAAGIVHCDLKPGNIMVDVHGRAKVLDFGLAKLLAPVRAAGNGADDTATMGQTISENGIIFGSVPYMSPEQAEGKPVDARSDIFSFGAVLYEMATGQRAFRGESQMATLAAILEKDPPSVTTVSPTTPPELGRLIARCLRKDVSRRSQSMADVKLALEELREESASGTLSRPAAVARARWLWPSAAIASVLIAAAALAWTYFNRGENHVTAPELVRVSPDDGHSYKQPAISPDGEFVAYVSNRSGKDELWLQQVGGGNPIQLTHASESVAFPAFFPDGKRILYVTTSTNEETSSIDVISTLGGDPRVLIQGGRIMNYDPLLSPDGRQIAYFEVNQGVARLMTASSRGGRPRELMAWAHMPHSPSGKAAWTSDSRSLLCLISKKSVAADTNEPDWYTFPFDGGEPAPTGVGDAARAAGLELLHPSMMRGNRMLFAAETIGRFNVWEIPLSPGSWRVRGVPHRLTNGTLSEMPVSISATGTVALQVGENFADLYMLPLSPATGRSTGIVRRLTQDSRFKSLWDPAGAPGSAYFALVDTVNHALVWNLFAIDLDSGKQALVTAGLPTSSGEFVALSPDGRQAAYSFADSDSYSIRMGGSGAALAEARTVCNSCGDVEGFSPDGRFLFHDPQAKVKYDPRRKRTVGLLEVASGRDRPWLEHPTDSVQIGGAVGAGSGWLWLTQYPPGSSGIGSSYVIPWREAPVPQAEWIKVPVPDAAGSGISSTGNYFYFFTGSRLMAIHFDPKTAHFSKPDEVKVLPGSAMMPTPDDVWTVRGPGLVFSRQETGNFSAWLMKLPR